MNPKKNRTKKWWLLSLGALILGMSAALFWDFLLGQQLYLFTDVGSDTINIFYPHLAHISEYLRTEGLPKWSFNQGMGQNLVPSGIENPFNWLLFTLGVEKLPYGFIYVEVLKLFFIGLIAFLYFKKISNSTEYSFITALLITFSAYVIVGGSWYGHSMIVLSTLLLLLAFEKLYQDNSYWLFPIAVFLLATTSLYFSAVFLLIYGLFRLSLDEQFNWEVIDNLGLKLLGLSVLGLAFKAPFLPSVFYRIWDSPRVSGTVSYFSELASKPIFGLEEPLHYITVFSRFFASDLLGNGSDFTGWSNYLEAPLFYCGLLPLLLLPQIFLVIKGKKRWIYTAFLGFWTLLLIFPYFRYAFYLFTGDYYKTALSVFIPISLLFCLVKVIPEIKSFKLLNYITLLSTIILFIVFLFFPHFGAKATQKINPSLRIYIVIFLMIYTCLIFLWRVEKIRYFVKIALLFCIIGELLLFNYQSIHKRKSVNAKRFEQSLGYKDYTVDAVKFLKEKDTGFYRLSKGYTSGYAEHKSLNDGKIQGYYSTTTYASFNQKYYVHFLQKMGVIDSSKEEATRWVRGLKKRPILQRLASVKYHLDKSVTLVDLADTNKTVLKQMGDVMVYENKFHLPFGFCYDTYVLESEFNQFSQAQKDKTLLKAFIPKKENVQQYQELTNFDLTTLQDTLHQNSWDNYYQPKHYLQLQSHTQNRIVGSIEVPKPQLLFFSIPYDRGWKAYVNGEKRPLELVNFGFMGLMLEQGRSEVILKFEPPFFKVGMIISLVALLVYLGVIAFSVYHQRQKE